VIVTDASALIYALVVEVTGGPLRQRLTEEAELHVPHIIDLEIASALRSLVARDRLSDELAAGCLADLLDLPIVRYPHDVLLARVWELRHNLTPYDAAYVALAEGLPAVLITADQSLSRAPDLRCEVELIS
jgi:predicted nucleic acid-binding protein